MRFVDESKKSRDYLLFLLKIEGKACYLSTIYEPSCIVQRKSVVYSPMESPSSRTLH